MIFTYINSISICFKSSWRSHQNCFFGIKTSSMEVNHPILFFHPASYFLYSTKGTPILAVVFVLIILSITDSSKS